VLICNCIPDKTDSYRSAFLVWCYHQNHHSKTYRISSPSLKSRHGSQLDNMRAFILRLLLCPAYSTWLGSVTLASLYQENRFLFLPSSPSRALHVLSLTPALPWWQGGHSSSLDASLPLFANSQLDPNFISQCTSCHILGEVLNRRLNCI